MPNMFAFVLRTRLAVIFAVIGVWTAGAVAGDESTPPTSGARQAERAQRVLRVAADPNNLPFTNRRGEGFENRVAELLAREMHAKLEYVWHAQRRGFFRETMTQGDCHLALGAPKGFERALTTRPYYRSSYMFVTRQDRGLKVHSLDDPQLRTLKLGVQVIGDDGVNTPPAHALAARGIIDNVAGYSVYGDYSRANPTAVIIEAVANGEVDVAMVWGPLAGYFAPRQPVKLQLTPIRPEADPSGMRFVFDIGVGVRKDDPALRDEVSRILTRCQREIDSTLDEFGVPRLPLDENQQSDRP
jgi:mxaJ protein